MEHVHYGICEIGLLWYPGSHCVVISHVSITLQIMDICDEAKLRMCILPFLKTETEQADTFFLVKSLICQSQYSKRRCWLGEYRQIEPRHQQFQHWTLINAAYVWVLIKRCSKYVNKGVNWITLLVLLRMWRCAFQIVYFIQVYV